MNAEQIEKLIAAKRRLDDLLRLKKFLESLIEKYTAIIIEPRKHRALEFVLRNALDNLNPRWSIQVFHGTENEVWLKELLEKSFQEDLPRITLKNLGVANLGTSQEYSKVLASREFIEAIPTETFLVFQTDSMINPAQKGLIDKFIHYDYVGAPWQSSILAVGNGGFSLRKRSTMLRIIDTLGPIKNINEDVYFSTGCLILKANVPTREQAKEFSIETLYHTHSFGLHRAWAYHTDKLEELCNQCEGLETLIQLQSISE
jgi:hypothetical protein